MTLLLLAGTSEATKIAVELRQHSIQTIASLAGATRSPKDIGLPTRIGGFGGGVGFLSYLKAEGITAVLDATHPFASRMSHRTARLCHERRVPYCQVLRPEWKPVQGDRWTQIQTEEAAIGHIAPASVVFLATGRQSLMRFANLRECNLICRQIDPPEAEFPFENGRYLVGRPPFSVTQEKDLFKKLNVDWLVTKNAGGEASKTKLTAARELDLKVLMIARPEQPDAVRVHTVEAALDWVKKL